MLRIVGVEQMSTHGGHQMLTPALYRTRITHLRRSPVHHYNERSSYSWYVDVDELPRVPWWLRPFARFEAADHFNGADSETLRQRVDAFLADNGIYLNGGRVTALLMPRVLGRAFNPLSLFWCHDADGALRCVVAEMHNTHGERHAYLLPPDQDAPAMVAKTFYTSPFNGVDGYYLVRAPRPDEKLDLTMSLHRENQPALVAHHARVAAAGQHRPDRPAAVQFAAGTADGGAERAGADHDPAAARRARRAAARGPA